MTRRQLFALLPAAAAARAADRAKVNMIVRSTRPEDLEMPMDGFQTWITPVERFFVRSHHYTPTVDVRDWRLTVEGEVLSRLSLEIGDLKNFPKVELVAVLECAGNGRGLYEPPVIGLQWKYGSVGNARWAGVRLADVLRKAGIPATAKHVLFDGADVPVGKQPEFQRTIPLAKAMDPNTLLAFEMNGEALTASHGFPLRLVVPGWAGDSWVKWVTRIQVLNQEFDGFFMKTAYRHPGKAVFPGVAVDPARMHPVEELRIKSVISSPVDGGVVPGGALSVQGVAWAGESPVASVEVSTDGGRRWAPARLGRDKAPFAWRLWTYDWKPATPGYYHVMARARAISGDTQPFVQEWNPSGYLNNSVHSIGVSVGEGSSPVPTPAPTVDFPAKVRAACLPCHDAPVIEQQRLSAAQWEAEVAKMIRWGAPVKPEDTSEILEFLVRRFGPRRAR